MKNWFKAFFKELKRVRWIRGSELRKIFWMSLLFIVVASLMFFLITLTFTSFWSFLGVGL